MFLLFCRTKRCVWKDFEKTVMRRKGFPFTCKFTFVRLCIFIVMESLSRGVVFFFSFYLLPTLFCCSVVINQSRKSFGFPGKSETSAYSAFFIHSSPSCAIFRKWFLNPKKFRIIEHFRNFFGFSLLQPNKKHRFHAIYEHVSSECKTRTDRPGY